MGHYLMKQIIKGLHVALILALFAIVGEASYRPTVIKSIQSGTVNGSGGTATITAVTTANSVLQLDGTISNDISGGGPVLSLQHCRLELTNSTTVTAYGNCTSARFTVTEYYGGVLKSAQRSTITLGLDVQSNTATVTSVSTAKSFVTHLGVADANDFYTQPCGSPQNQGSQVVQTVTLTNATTVTASRFAAAGNTQVVGIQVVEFR